MLRSTIHRDLKPENIFVLDPRSPGSAEAAGEKGVDAGSGAAAPVGEDFVKIVDFGIAKDTRAAASAEPDAAVPVPPPRPPTADLLAVAKARADGDATSQQRPPDTGETFGSTPAANQGLTRVGASLGTPRYMAPEQVDGIDIDARADQYALGCILYQMICGQLPFSAPSAMELLSMHLFEKVRPLRQRYPELGVPESLDTLVLRMLAKSKQERFPSMSEVATALEREIEVLSVQRGDKVAITSGLAALLGGRRGTHFIIRGIKLPLAAVAATALSLIAVLSLGGILGYRHFFAESPTLRKGELQALEARARQILVADSQATTTPPELRLEAMKGLAQTHDSAYRGQLEQALRDPSPPVQGRAADALGQLGDRKGVPALLELLQHTTDLQVKLAAAQALVQLGEDKGQRVLESLLASARPEERLRAASLLCLRGHEKALALLTEAIDKNLVPEPLRLGFLACLTQAGNEAARQKLQLQLRSGPGPEALLAAARLAQLGQEDGRAFLRERILQPGTEQLVAARFLAAPDEPQVAALFRQVLNERRAGVPARLLASEGLGLCGQLLDARLLGKQLAASQEAHVQLSAAAAIVLLARNEPGALSEQSLLWARGALTDGEWTVRESAVAVIGDSAVPDAVPLLTTLLSDGHPAVRQSAARALGRRREEGVLLALRGGLRDTESTVRQESLRSLLQLSQNLPAAGPAWQRLHDSAGSWVKELVASGSESEQTLARSLLLKLGDRSQLDPLRELARSADAEIRRLVVLQLGRELELLLGMLKDTVFAVRFSAAWRLAEAGDQRGIPVLKEAIERKSPEALLALGLLRRLGQEVVAPAGLSDLLSAGSVAQRLSALDSVSSLPAEQAVSLLKRLARDLDPQVRRRAAEVAAALPAGPAALPGLSILRLLAADGDAAVRARAAALLAPLLAAATNQPPPLVEAEDKPAATPSPPPAAKAEGPAAPASAEPEKPVAAGAAEKPGSGPAAAQGMGSLIVEAPPLVQFQLDRGRWQTASKRAIVLPAGPHELAALSGVQQLELTDKQTLTVKVPESPIEKLTSGGLEAYDKKDLRKAQKLFEKASSLCSRERKHPQPCSDLSIEINYHLGQIHEAGERFADAVTAYQKVVQGAATTRPLQERRAAAQSAMARLLPSLGQLVIPKKVNNRCQEVTLYMVPGTHVIEIEGDRQTVKVRARETVRLGSCE